MAHPVSTAFVRQWAWESSHLWLRPLIVGGVLVASALLASRASLLVLGLLMAVGAAVVILRFPPLGLASVIPVSLVVPLAFSTGTGTGFNATVVVLMGLLALWLLDMWGRRDLRLLPSGPIRPLIVFVVVAVIATLAGMQPWLAFAGTAPVRTQMGGLTVFVLSAGAFLLVAHQVKAVRWLQRFTWLYIALGALFVVGRAVPAVGSVTGRFFVPGADGSVFWIWLVALAFSQAAFNSRLAPHWRLALGAVVLTAFVALSRVSGWTSGWLPSLVALVVVLWAGAPRVGLIATAAGGAWAMLNRGQVDELLLGGDNEYSLNTRQEAWGLLSEIVQATNPVLGLGPANYYYYTPLFPISGYAINFNSHNNYMDIIAQTGLLGLACFIWFVWAVGRLGWQLRQRVPAGFERAYVYGALGGLVGMLDAAMLGDWVLPFVYNVGLTGLRASVMGWFFLGGLVALEQLARRDAQPVDAPDEPRIGVGATTRPHADRTF
jgi:hypothetical protein